jgi:cytochrome c oxidase assembly protein subunit 15
MASELDTNAPVTPTHQPAVPGLLLRGFRYLVVGVFFLIALGGSVRVMKAGLACPDWPLCFGRFIPDYHPQVYFEFIHRVAAGSVAVVTILLQVMLLRSPHVRGRVKALGLVAICLLLGQVVMGALTVTQLLQSYAVVSHLLLGTSFFCVLLWIYLSLKSEGPVERGQRGWLLGFSIFVGIMVFGQITLGGLVASNFASLVCIDFPTCQGQWFPTFSGLIGLHVVHRLGAYLIFCLAFLNGVIMVAFATSRRVRRLAMFLFACVCAQVGLGVANVVFLTPPLIAVAHLALAVGVLSLAVRQVHLLTRKRTDGLIHFGDRR